MARKKVIIERTTVQFKPHTHHNSSCNIISVHTIHPNNPYYNKVCLTNFVLDNKKVIKICSGPKYLTPIPNSNIRESAISPVSYSRSYEWNEVPLKYKEVIEYLTALYNSYDWPGAPFERSR